MQNCSEDKENDKEFALGLVCFASMKAIANATKKEDYAGQGQWLIKSLILLLDVITFMSYYCS